MTNALLLSAVVLAVAPVATPTFVMSSAGSKSPSAPGMLLRYSGTTAELLGTDGTNRVADVYAIRQAGKSLPAYPNGPMLITATGDRILGRFAGGEAERIQFRPTLIENGVDPIWNVSFATISVLWLTTPPADTPFDPAKYAWRGDERRDVLLFRNGDTLRGTLESVTRETISFKAVGDAESRRVSPAAIAAVAFNPALARSRKPREVYIHVVLANGTRIDLTNAAADGKGLSGKTLFGAAFQVPLAEVVSLDVRRGKAIDLSDITAKSSQQTDFLGLSWQPGLDRTVQGEPLRLMTSDGEATFDKGLGTRPRSRITYALDGKYRRFESLVGLDAASRGGSAIVRVMVDDKERGEAITLLPGRSRVMAVDLSGAKELTLAIDFGTTGGVQANVNWGDARLVE